MLLTCADYVLAAPPVFAEQSWQHGGWIAHRRNGPDGNRLFCALESRSNGTLFRIIKYTDNNDTILQLSNAAWTFGPGVAAPIRLDFALGGATSYQANLDGITGEKKYLYLFRDENRYRTILDLISKTTAITVLDPNNTVIAKFSGSGSGAALSAFSGCLENS